MIRSNEFIFGYMAAYAEAAYKIIFASKYAGIAESVFIERATTVFDSDPVENTLARDKVYVTSRKL